MDRKKSTVDKTVIRVSVRTLVEFLLRSGDLDNRRGGWADKEAMQAGSRIHRKIQKKRGPEYQAEVPLRYERDCGEYTLIVEGRADGIYTNKRGTTIEEIKGIYADLERLTEPVPVHLAQAKCYAYIFSRDNDLDKINVCMTYANLESELEKKFRSTYTREEVSEWFENLVGEYEKWASFRMEWVKKRDASMQGLEFPFDYRPGQKEMVRDIYRTILRKKQLFVQAPTGVGKTMSAVFPSVRALGQGAGDRIFYLTAKTITRTVAEEAFSVLRDKGLLCKSQTLTAKEKICVLDECDCNPDACPRARGHFDRVNDALYDMITNEDEFSRDKIAAQAEKWNVCPHEFQLDLSGFVDAVICDYNYVFDPKARLKRYFGEGTSKGEYLFLIDEAHNLVDRGRDMFSADLSLREIVDAERLLRQYPPKEAGEKKGKKKKVTGEKPLDEKERILRRNMGRAKGTLKALHTMMQEFYDQCRGTEEISFLGDYLNMLLNLAGQMEEILADLGEGDLRKNLLEFYFRISTFVQIYELVDENYVIYRRREGEDNLIIRLFCVNPAVNLQKCLDKGRSTVFYSATLLPVQYYKQLLSGRTDDYAVYIESPFDPFASLTLIGQDVSSRYKRRSLVEYIKMANYIRLITNRRKGNYLVFFPSYAMLENISEAFLSAYGSGEDSPECIFQQPSMTEEEKEDFLNQFTENRDRTLIGFCVMGGIFSEGIDLTGEKLIGSIIVGTGLPQVGDERELLRTYYDRQGKDGFDYAYRYPGMNKVLQAAGRVIRTMNDRGVIALLDDRFAFAEYSSLFPREWKNLKVVNLNNAGHEIEDFWKNN